MMETKLLAALCALLLINFGSADHDANVTPSSAPKSAPAVPAAESVPTSIPDHVSHAATTPSPNGTDTSSGVTGSLSNDTSTEGKSIPELPQPKKDNNTDVVSPAEAAGAEKNQTNSTASQPPSPPSGSPTPTSHNPLKSTTISPSPSAHPAPVDTISTTVTPTNTSHHAAVPLPDSTTASAPPTSAPTPESPKHQTTTTTATTQSSSTSSTSSSQEVPNSELTTLTPQNTSEPVGRPGTSSEGHQTTTTVASPSSSTAQTKAHADTPSQLNVGGDTTMVHDSPTLDPLLAGLVSAFIITAVIITLLLFLKLRRRDNRPEFRRLQDLPMDDMMEDTPLSMYSY